MICSHLVQKKLARSKPEVLKAYAAKFPIEDIMDILHTPLMSEENSSVSDLTAEVRQEHHCALAEAARMSSIRFLRLAALFLTL